jgi:hypothetical protein
MPQNSIQSALAGREIRRYDVSKQIREDDEYSFRRSLACEITLQAIIKK